MRIALPVLLFALNALAAPSVRRDAPDNRPAPAGQARPSPPVPSPGFANGIKPEGQKPGPPPVFWNGTEPKPVPAREAKPRPLDGNGAKAKLPRDSVDRTEPKPAPGRAPPPKLAPARGNGTMPKPLPPKDGRKPPHPSTDSSVVKQRGDLLDDTNVTPPPGGESKSKPAPDPVGSPKPPKQAHGSGNGIEPKPFPRPGRNGTEPNHDPKLADGLNLKARVDAADGNKPKLGPYPVNGMDPKPVPIHTDGAKPNPPPKSTDEPKPKPAPKPKPVDPVNVTHHDTSTPGSGSEEKSSVLDGKSA